MALKNQPFKKLGNILKQVAPLALSAASGGAAPLIMSATKGIFGEQAGTDGGFVAAIEQALTTPEGMAKLKELELAAQKLEADTGIRFAELEVEDRQGARDLAKATSIWPQVALSVMFVVGYFVILGLFFSSTLTIPMNEAFMVMLGVLTAGVPQVMAFWLGSSSGSKQKTDILGSK